MDLISSLAKLENCLIISNASEAFKLSNNDERYPSLPLLKKFAKTTKPKKLSRTRRFRV